jgi:hypothetical protein
MEEIVAVEIAVLVTSRVGPWHQEWQEGWQEG